MHCLATVSISILSHFPFHFNCWNALACRGSWRVRPQQEEACSELTFRDFPQFSSAQCRAQKWVPAPGPVFRSQLCLSPPVILTSRFPRIKHRTQTSPPSFSTVFSFCPNGFLVCSYLEFSSAFLFIWKLIFWHKCLPPILFFWGEGGVGRAFAFTRSEWCIRRHAGFVNKLILIYFQQDNETTFWQLEIHLNQAIMESFSDDSLRSNPHKFLNYRHFSA